VQVTIKLSGNLACIHTSLPMEMVMEFTVPVTIGQLLIELAISPLIITTVVVNNQLKDQDFLLTEDSEVLLIGPMAGG